MKYICLIGLILFSLSLRAEQFFIPTVYIAAKNFNYSADNGGVSGRITSLGLQFTGVYDEFYLSIAAEKNPRPSEQSTRNLVFNRVNFDRSDVTISLGYEVNPFIRTFTGYKYGKTTLTELAYSPLANAKTSLEGHGIFFGAGGGWEVKNWGFISFSAAYAMLQANYASPLTGKLRGDSSGTSLTLGWKAAITSRLAYDILLTRHDYYYENFNQFDSDISERFFSIRLGLSYVF
jgi:hypothetical protein